MAPMSALGSNTNPEVARNERRALVLTAFAAVATILWLAWPVRMGVLIGVLLAFIFRPIYERLARRWHAPTAALATVLGSTFTIALTFAGLVWILVHDGTILGSRLVDSLQGGEGRKIANATTALASRIGVSAQDLEAKARTLIEGASARVAGFAGAVASTTAGAVLALLFVMLTMYFVLRRWEALVAATQDTLPLRPDYTLKLLAEFRRVGQATLLSTVFIGLVEGALGTIGYWIAGLPRPLFFGALTAVASLVPGLGTMLVWVPAGVALILVGHVGYATFLLLWGVVVVTGIPTYIIRPRLVGGDGNVPALATFTGLFGGAAVLGLKGLILGPVLMTLAIVVLRIYADEARARRHATSPP
jgi:predicted PurR-regulated permease PerM